MTSNWLWEKRGKCLWGYIVTDVIVAGTAITTSVLLGDKRWMLLLLLWLFNGPTYERPARWGASQKFLCVDEIGRE